MPKIPIFQTQARPTTEVGSIKSNIQIPLTQNIGTVLKPVTDAIVKHRVNEKNLENKAEALTLENESIFKLNEVFDEASKLDNKEQAFNLIQSKSKTIQDEFSNKASNKFVKSAFNNSFLSEVQKGIFKTNRMVSKNVLDTLDNQVSIRKNLILTEAYLAKNPMALQVAQTDLENLFEKTYKGRIDVDQYNKLIQSIPGEMQSFEVTQAIISDPGQAFSDLMDKDKFVNLDINKRAKFIQEAKTILTPRINNNWKNYVAAAALGKEPVPFNMNLAKKVLPAETVVKMENQLETIDDTIGKVKILNSINSKELKTTIDQYELEIDAKVKAGAVDFIMGEKKKEYYNNIVNNRQELLSTDPVNFIIQTNEDIKTAVEAIESAEGDQKNTLEFELATSLVKIQTDLGVPKYNQKVMTSNQSKQFVLNYKNGDQNTRVAMLQGLDLQFGDLNNKAFQQLLNDGLPETAILSSYFQNPQLTEAFLSFDSEDKRKELKEWGDQNGVKFKKLQKDIRTSKAIRLFEDIVATNTGANSADTVDQMNSIVEMLTYYTLNEMFTNSDTNEVKARKKAISLIKDNFQIEDTYYIPKIWDGKKLLDSHVDTVVAKTEIIKDHYLDQWGAVAFGSMKDDTLTVDIQSEFNINVKENGEWRNTSDGEGLIFGIILPDGEFAPVKNANNDFLQFNFDDDSYILPGTDIKMNMSLNDFAPKEDNQP